MELQLVDVNRIGHRVADLIRAKGWQQKALAGRAEIPPSTLNRLIRGRNAEWSVTDATKVAHAFRIPLAELIEGESVPDSPLSPYETNPAYRQVVANLESLTPHDRQRVAEFIGWLAEALASRGLTRLDEATNNSESVGRETRTDGTPTGMEEHLDGGFSLPLEAEQSDNGSTNDPDAGAANRGRSKHKDRPPHRQKP